MMMYDDWWLFMFGILALEKSRCMVYMLSQILYYKTQDVGKEYGLLKKIG